jgi:hypothetical protein
MSGDHTSIASAEGYDAPGGGAQPGAAPAERDTPQRLRPSRWRPRPFAIVVLLVGLVVTAALTVPAELTYRHNERRLLNLQTRLTTSLLGTAPQQTQAILARIVGLAAESPDPAGTFNDAVGPLIAPNGQYASATLAKVDGDQVTVVARLGGAPIRSLSDPATLAVFRTAARHTTLSTARATAPGTQKLGYLLSAKGSNGTFVISAAQQLPWPYRASVPKSNPNANLDYAIYFGQKTDAADLVVSSRSMPHGIVSRATVPFGDNVLTFVASPRGSLAGGASEYLPWGIALIGALASVAFAFGVWRLARRRATAESAAWTNREMYQEQRSMSETLQRSLLPRTIPAFPGIDIAARYIPGTIDAEVGGDWYSVIAVDEDRFVFVVGDVSGHGIPAAGAMASLRFTARTLARLGFAPDEVLRRTDEEIDIMDDGHFATALVGSVSMGKEEMVVASAGHLPPYLVRDRTGAFVTVAVGTPLGIGMTPALPTTVTFPRGSTLVAFTDGLIERRDEGIEARLGLLAEVASVDAPSAEALLAHIVDTLTADGHEDDIAILVIRSVAGEPGDAVPMEERAPATA